MSTIKLKDGDDEELKKDCESKFKMKKMKIKLGVFKTVKITRFNSCFNLSRNTFSNDVSSLNCNYQSRKITPTNTTITTTNNVCI